MKILMYQWKAYNLEDICQNLMAMGFTIDCLQYELDNIEEDENFRAKVVKCLKEGDYGMVMSVNYFPVLAYACHDAGVPYVSWTCDSPLLALQTKSVFLPTNHIFSFDRSVYLTLRAMGVAHAYHLPLCVDVHRIENLPPVSEDTLDFYQGDISFVGSLYEKNSYDEMQDLPDYLRGYFDATMLAQMEIYGDNFLEKMITDEIEEELERRYIAVTGDEYFGGAAMIMANVYLGMKLASLERHKILKMLSEKFLVHFYTNSDTSTLPKVKNCGKIDYMTQMPYVFKESKINLNTSLRNIKTGIPLRVWDILGAGGFVLTNYQPELELYFENGRHLVWFEDHRDMVQKAEYYLTHEEERKQIARMGHELVSKEHTYPVRLRQMMDLVRENA